MLAQGGASSETFLPKLSQEGTSGFPSERAA